MKIMLFLITATLGLSAQAATVTCTLKSGERTYTATVDPSKMASPYVEDNNYRVDIFLSKQGKLDLIVLNDNAVPASAGARVFGKRGQVYVSIGSEREASADCSMD
jgi:hypothetical protein